ncbi:MAG: lipid A biosynthesis acyltransferase [Myxococcales bacterium]|nr:lipid A biosynthesis acyltransferase [Myxococcales bacterium]
MPIQPSSSALPSRWGTIQKMKNTLIYFSLRTLAFILKHTPWLCLKLLARLLAPMAYYIARKETQTALENLEIAFPERPLSERRKIVRAMYDHLAISAMEIIQIEKFVATDNGLSLQPEQEQLFREALAQNKGVVAVTGHIGNWELLAQFLVQQGIPMVTIARPTYDPRITKWLDQVRSQYGLEVIWRGENTVSREMIRTFRSNKILALLMDQDTRVQSIFSPFFGKPASTPSAAAALALRFDAPIIFGWNHRTPTGHKFYFEKIIPPEIEDKEAAKQQLIDRLNQKLEDAIRQQPEQWVWLHKRWKTRPENTQE